MKKYLFPITLALFLLFSCVKPQQTGPHFVVPEGNPFMPMHVFTIEATIEKINGKNITVSSKLINENNLVCTKGLFSFREVEKEKALKIATKL